MIDETFIDKYIYTVFDGVEDTDNFGYTFYFYKDDHRLPFISLANADNDYDQVSNLNRPGIFRLNIGVSRQTFESLFGSTKVDVGSYDFTALDKIMPHPDYAPQSFICVLNPTKMTFETLKPMLAEAYEIARRKYNRRNPSDASLNMSS